MAKKIKIYIIQGIFLYVFIKFLNTIYQFHGHIF